jgi:hypothetical protein
MKKLVLMSAVLATMALASACSSGAKEATATSAVETKAEVAETTKAEAMNADEQELVGTISDIKNVMFNVTDDKGTTYSFTFDAEAPKGLDTVKDGDKVKVTFKGELSEVDPVTDIVSVEAAK